jgi:hypothetical protein
MKYLVVFGSNDYELAKSSLIKSSKNYFDHCFSFSKQDIESEFYNNNANILDQQRGAGYWLWKPYFIYEILNCVKDGDIVFYVDAGNIFIDNPEQLYQHFDSKGIILFDNRDGMQNGESAQNFISCKKDCFVLMNCDTDDYVYGKHLNASYQIYKKSDYSLSFIKEYLITCQNEFILTDTPNIHGDNYPGYYDHRHDQSVLSLLAIKHGIEPLPDPSEWGNQCQDRKFPQMFLHHRRKDYVYDN